MSFVNAYTCNAIKAISAFVISVSMLSHMTCNHSNCYRDNYYVMTWTFYIRRIRLKERGIASSFAIAVTDSKPDCGPRMSSNYVNNFIKNRDRESNAKKKIIPHRSR